MLRLLVNFYNVNRFTLDYSSSIAYNPKKVSFPFNLSLKMLVATLSRKKPHGTRSSTERLDQRVEKFPTKPFHPRDNDGKIISLALQSPCVEQLSFANFLFFFSYLDKQRRYLRCSNSYRSTLCTCRTTFHEFAYAVV